MNFEQISEVIRGRIQLKPARVKSLYGYALASCRLVGEFWECGVFSGGSARLLAEVMRTWRLDAPACCVYDPPALRLFDTFSGFANISPQDGTYPKVGMFADTSAESVQAFVSADFAKLYPGPIPGTFAGLEQSRIAFAHIDVDLYEPTKEALKFILPRLVDGGLIIVDDYDDPHYPGAALAVNELVKRVVRNYFGEHDRQAVIVGSHGI